MASTNYCADCDVEFKVRHDADHAYFPILYCPFCGEEIDTVEQYRNDEEEE